MLLELETILGMRIKLGLSQEQLCNQVGIRQPYLSMIETGKRSPSYAVLKKISEILGNRKTLRYLDSISNKLEILEILEEHEVVDNNNIMRYITVSGNRKFIVATGRKIEEQN